MGLISASGEAGVPGRQGIPKGAISLAVLSHPTWRLPLTGPRDRGGPAWARSGAGAC
jgi:hypothetical protein